ncbi:hypothetical protein RYX36_028158 [Vicia faba]
MHENNMFRRSGFPVRWWRFPTTGKLSSGFESVWIVFTGAEKLFPLHMYFCFLILYSSGNSWFGYVQDARSGFCNDQYETWHLVVRMDMEMDPYGMA